MHKGQSFRAGDADDLSGNGSTSRHQLPTHAVGNAVGNAWKRVLSASWINEQLARMSHQVESGWSDSWTTEGDGTLRCETIAIHWASSRRCEPWAMFVVEQTMPDSLPVFDLDPFRCRD